MLNITYLSHSCFLFETENYTVIVDPFISGNPTFPVGHKDLKPDFIVLTHGHGDHLGDAIELSKKYDATIIAVNELANYVISKGAKAHNMHIGGSFKFPFGKLKFTIAHHGSGTDDFKYLGEPAGVLLFINDKIFYHTGDTGIFYDMKLIGEMNKIDYVFLPIGDNYTMGIDDAVKAVELINPDIAVPMHYNTFPIISADPNEFKNKVENLGKKCKIFEYGETIKI